MKKDKPIINLKTQSLEIKTLPNKLKTTWEIEMTDSFVSIDGINRTAKRIYDDGRIDILDYDEEISNMLS